MANRTDAQCSEENADVIMGENTDMNASGGVADIIPVPSRSVVHYKSTALDEIGMLKNRRPISEVMNCPGVRAASETAERVREVFKRKEKEKKEREEEKLKIHDGDKEIGKAERYDRRTKLNRQSAAASRVRKEAYIKALEEQLLLHDDRYKELERNLVEEQTAHSKLKQDIQSAAQLAASSGTSVNANTAAVSSTTAHDLTNNNNNIIKQEDRESGAVDFKLPELNNNPPLNPSPAIIQQIFSDPNPPVPSNEIELNLPGIGIGSSIQQLLPEDLMGLELPFEVVPQNFLENTSPHYPELNIDEMLK